MNNRGGIPHPGGEGRTPAETMAMAIGLWYQRKAKSLLFVICSVVVVVVASAVYVLVNNFCSLTVC